MGEVILLEGAEKDILEIYFALFDSNEAKAERFSSSVDRAISDIGSFPEIGTEVILGSVFRRKLIPGFYRYGAFYVIEANRVFIHAVLDLRQRPEAIRQRLNP